MKAAKDRYVSEWSEGSERRRTREALGPVWYVESAVDGSLECAEDVRSSGGARESDIEVAAEGVSLVDVLHGVHVAGGLLQARVRRVHAQLLQQLQPYSDTE